MLFDYRYWLRRFLDWLLHDADEDEKMVTKGLIGEAFLYKDIIQLVINVACTHTCAVTAEIKFERITISGVGVPNPLLTFLFLIRDIRCCSTVI